MKNKIVGIALALSIALTMPGCVGGTTTVISSNESETVPVSYEALMYDNSGNNFLNFTGNSFTIEPNKAKQWGWDTSGSWVSWYETSSVVTIGIDGNYIQSCGSSVLFKDTRLEMLEIPTELNTKEASREDGYDVSVSGRLIGTYYGLKNWWYDMHENGQHGQKLILVQSQDGYNIGAFMGDDVTWEVEENLPKTTKIMIDGLPLYIHRCNFTIIDSQLIDDKAA